MKFEISDWVQAKTRNGEFVHGFIESMDSAKGIAKVFVVNSDNAESIGKPTAVLGHWLREMPVSPVENAEQLKSLIDIALSTRDEQWFNELTHTLLSISKPGDNNKTKPIANPAYTNRLGYTV